MAAVKRGRGKGAEKAPPQRQSRAKSKAAGPATTADVTRPVGVTRAELAAALGVTPQRIGQWMNDGAPVLRRGQRGQHALYDVEAVREWRAARDQETADALSLEEERAKLARAQRLKLEQEGRVRSGELLERAAVEAESEALLSALRSRLLQIPRQLGQSGLVSREHEPAVTTVIHDALRELADWKWQPAPDDDEDAE